MRISDLEVAASALIPARYRRSEPRFACEIPVRAVISHPSGSTAMLREVVIQELTAREAAVCSPNPIKKGWLVKLTLPVGSGCVEVNGRVARHRTTKTDDRIMHVHRVLFVDAQTDTLHALGFVSEAPAPVPASATPAESIAAPITPDLEPESMPSGHVSATNLHFGQSLMTTRNAFTLPNVSTASANPLLTVFGGNARLEGRFVIEDSIEVQCQISGELHVGGTMIIGERGEVSANITTVNAVIRGQYEGNLRATGSVEISPTGRVSGNIECNDLAIAKGADFTGTIERVAPEVADVSQTVTVATQTPVVFDADRAIPLQRAPLVDAPLVRAPRGQVELT